MIPTHRYESDGEDNKSFLKQFVCSWFSSNQSQSGLILNKFAQVVVALFLIDYPQRKWDPFFRDLMALCRSETQFLLFLKILYQINTEIADRELNKSAEVRNEARISLPVITMHLFRIPGTGKECSGQRPDEGNVYHGPGKVLVRCDSLVSGHVSCYRMSNTGDNRCICFVD